MESYLEAPATTISEWMVLPAVSIDSDGRVRSANSAAAALIGDQIREQGCTIALRGARDIKADPQELWESVLRSPKGHMSGVAIVVTLQGGRTYESVASLSRSAEEQMLLCVLMPRTHELQAALSIVASALTGGRDLDSTLKQISTSARELCFAERAYFETYDDSRGVMTFRALSSRSGRETLPHVESDPSTGLTAYVRKSRCIFRTGDVALDQRLTFKPLFANTRSKAAVPLLYTEQKDKAEEQFLGVLMLDGTSVNQFGVEHEQVLDIFAKYATLAIAHMRLLREMRQDSAAIVNQLRALQESLGGSKILHEGKNVIRQAVDELTQVEQGVPTQAGRRRRTPIRQAIERLGDMSLILADLLDSFRRPPDDEDEPKSVDLQNIVNRVLNIVAVPEDRVLLVVTAEPDAPTVRAHPREMMFMIFNLVQNAIAAIPPQEKRGEIQVQIGKSPEHEGYCRLIVGDTGVGMERRFLELVRAEQSVSRFRGGSGIGLVTIRETVRKANGFLSVDSKLGKGTRFIIDLPAA